MKTEAKSGEKLINWDGLRRFRVRKIRKRIGAPVELSDDEFVLDIVLYGLLIPEGVKALLRNRERNIITDIYLGRSIAADVLMDIEQLSLPVGMSINFGGHK